MSISPSPGEDLSNLNPPFKDFDIVILDYNGELWNVSTREAFLEYVKSGGIVRELVVDP